MKVKIYFDKNSPFGETTEVIQNITEIHFNYKRFVNSNSNRIAFESDIDGTGVTYEIKHIKEFEAK